MRILVLSDNYMENRSGIDPFRLELMAELAKRSSEFMYIQVNDYMSWEGEYLKPENRDFLTQQITGFSPEAVVSLNASGLNQDIRSVLTNSQIFTWFIDNPSRSPSALKGFQDNETILCATRYMMKEIYRLHPTVHVDRVRYLPFCCNPDVFRSDGVAPLKTCDVSFVGTLWDIDGLARVAMSSGSADLNSLPEIVALVDQYKRDYDFPVGKIIKQRFDIEMFSEREIKNFVDDYLSTVLRLSVLTALSKFDLEIYGTVSTWPKMALVHDPLLFTRFNPRPITASAELAQLYSRSRVCLSIAHHQAQSGFPIRIFDVMSSGTPLLTDRHSELNEHFEEGVMFSCFDDTGSARENLRSLLSDRKRRLTMGIAARNEVEKSHTFKVRISQMLENNAVGDCSKAIVVSKSFSISNFKNFARNVGRVHGGILKTRVSGLATKRTRPHDLKYFIAKFIIIFLNLSRVERFAGSVKERLVSIRLKMTRTLTT